MSVHHQVMLVTKPTNHQQNEYFMFNRFMGFSTQTSLHTRQEFWNLILIKS